MVKATLSFFWDLLYHFWEKNKRRRLTHTDGLKGGGDAKRTMFETQQKIEGLKEKGFWKFWGRKKGKPMCLEIKRLK